MPLDNPEFATITELSHAYRSREVSPVEITGLMLERIERLDPRLRSFVTVTADKALGQARQAEQEMARGVFRGPMHGIPVGMKDLCKTAGVRTTWGTKVFSDYIPAEDATVVRRLTDAGAVMLGKLQLTEGAFGAHHPDIPAPLNPWGEAYWSGVSSSGSGVATAAGLCYGAIGTDTGGSIRYPSGANGLTGLKPTWGRVSRYGVLPLADSLDHIGPMTRSAEDAGALLGAMAGEDPLDPTSLPASVPDYLANIGGGVRGLKIGIDPADMDGICDAATLGVINEAKQLLTGLGATFHEYRVPPTTAAMRKNWGRYCATETAIAHEATYPSLKDEYGPALAGLIEAGRRLGATDLMKMHHARLEFAGDLRKLFETFDLLLVPVHPFSNPTIARYDQLLRDPQTMNESLRYTAPYNMSGNPTITLPGGFTEEGLPVGFQLVGRHLDEALLVRAGHAFQQVTDWHKRHPELTENQA